MWMHEAIERNWKTEATIARAYASHVLRRYQEGEEVGDEAVYLAEQFIRLVPHPQVEGRRR